MDTVKLTDTQAAIIAAAIAPDIKAYIAAHREEYETFLATKWPEIQAVAEGKE